MEDGRNAGHEREAACPEEFCRLRRGEFLHDVFAGAGRDDRQHCDVQRVGMV
ncbi:hypothetical protein D3C71_1931640 [compost metagenome]